MQNRRICLYRLGSESLLLPSDVVIRYPHWPRIEVYSYLKFSFKWSGSVRREEMLIKYSNVLEKPDHDTTTDRSESTNQQFIHA